MATTEELEELPDDTEALKAGTCSLLQEHGRGKQRAEEQTRRSADLCLENLRLRLEFKELLQREFWLDRLKRGRHCSARKIAPTPGFRPKSRDEINLRQGGQLAQYANAPDCKGVGVLICKTQRGKRQFLK
jgi:hypothetical protein